MTVYIILAAMILILGLVCYISIRSNVALKKEINKDEKKIKQEEHVIHAMEEVWREEGKINRRANDRRNETDKSDSTVDIVNNFNEL